MIRPLVAVLAACLLGVAAPRSLLAQDAPHDHGPEHAAHRAAEAWLELLAAENYQESWRQASTPFRGAVTAERWAQQIGAVRQQIGQLESRRLQRAEHVVDPPNSPPGEYVIVTFESRFSRLPAAVETVPMMLEDGEWRLAGYFVRPG